MQHQAIHTVVRFAAFEVDPKNAELRKHGVRIKLQEQPFKILIALLESPGEIVTRDQLRERIWGNDTFVDFDHGLSAAVNRLRAALGDSAEHPRYIETVARRGYRFIASIENAPTPQPSAPTPPKSYWPAVALLSALALAGIAAWFSLNPKAPPPRLTQLTALTGSETMPSLSPDGKQIAYVWNGEKEDNPEIYVKMVDSEATLRLTNSPGADLLPSWSPDGTHIAFARVHGQVGIYIVSPLGGPERKIHEFPGIDTRPPGPETAIVGNLLYPIVGRPSWSADGKFLAVTRRSEPPQPGDGSVLLVPVNGGAPRTLLTPEPGAHYQHPTFSPDGRSLAVNLCGTAKPPCQIQQIRLTADLHQDGPAQTLHSYRGQLRGIAWAPGGESLIVGGFSLPRFYSWRLSVTNPGEPERIDLAGADAIWPTVSRTGNRFAFGRSTLQADLWRLGPSGKPEFFLSSTARDISPRFSPDGKRIAFESARNGESDIWVADADGANLLQLGHHQDLPSGSPAWSPDGRLITYDTATPTGGRDIWVVESTGGSPRRVQKEIGDCNQPAWAADGQHIFCSQPQGSTANIWRIPASGGPGLQITKSGGATPRVSSDGKTLFFLRRSNGQDQLFAQPLSGGEPKQLSPDPIVRVSYHVDPTGIFYITPRDSDWCDIKLYDFATQKTRVIAEIQRPVAFGLSVSPDRKTFLSSRPITGSDLMLIDHLRFP